MTEYDRRTFLRRVAGASAATAAAALMPPLLPRPGLGMAASGGGLGTAAWRGVPCNLCGVGCGLVVQIEDGRAVAARPDPDSPVNGGLACVKGYHAIQALYARDRITRARVRRGGRQTTVGIADALDEVARRLSESTREHGKDSVGVYGSGDWSIPAGYVASKLFKGAIGTNNVAAELETSSVGAGLRSSFGRDASIGCYEDIEHADAFVLWDANVAEEQPVLFSRMLERRRMNPDVRLIDLSTRTTRTSYAADRSLIFAPQAELALANAICHEIVRRGWVDDAFVRRHVSFRRGRTELGYGLADDGVVADAGVETDRSDYVRFLDAYSPERAERISGVPAGDIRWLASLYADRGRDVVSVPGAGVTRHARGTWSVNLLHNIHLLVGKIASPGNGALALSTRPSEAGTVHESGLRTDGLPRGTVTDPADRELAARIWGVPVENLDPEPTHHPIGLFRAVERGDIRFLWIQAADPLTGLPNLDRYRRALADADCFVVVSAAYPSPTVDAADLVLPTALWFERDGMYGNAERRIQHFEGRVEAGGDAAGEAWQMIEVARRLGFERLFPWERAEHVARIWAEYGRFRDTERDRLPALDELSGRAGRMWPYVDGRETRWRYNAAYDPSADPPRGEFDFYDAPDGRARIWLRPYEPPVEAPDAEFPFRLTVGAVLEHSGSGELTRRIAALHRALPRGYVELNAADAEGLGVADRET
ncbi:MAG: molybdopterin-dependent oxidoreductase, partial [Gemmatimonadota bacterium]